MKRGRNDIRKYDVGQKGGILYVLSLIFPHCCPLYFPIVVHLLLKLNVQGSSLLLITMLKSPFYTCGDTSEGRLTCKNIENGNEHPQYLKEKESVLQQL